MNEIKKSLPLRVWNALQNPWMATALNLSLANGAYIANRYIQVFCQPVTWAAIVMVIAFIPVIFFPLIRKFIPQILPLAYFLRGIAFCICIYCIIFLENDNFILPVFVPLGIGILGLAPHIFAVQMVVQLFLKRDRSWQILPFAMGIIFSLSVAAYFIYDFQISARLVEELVLENEAYDGPHSNTVERIVGMHFKYHTRILTGIDGWRPPLHDPALILGLWSVGWKDPVELSLEERIAHYQTLFPNSSVMVDCVCAENNDGRRYRSSPYFEKLSKNP